MTDHDVHKPAKWKQRLTHWWVGALFIVLGPYCFLRPFTPAWVDIAVLLFLVSFVVFCKLVGGRSEPENDVPTNQPDSK